MSLVVEFNRTAVFGGASAHKINILNGNGIPEWKFDALTQLFTLLISCFITNSLIFVVVQSMELQLVILYCAAGSSQPTIRIISVSIWQIQTELSQVTNTGLP